MGGTSKSTNDSIDGRVSFQKRAGPSCAVEIRGGIHVEILPFSIKNFHSLIPENKK